MAVTKYIVFRLNDQKYSMKLTKINGIEYVYHVVPVPMGPACINGIIHLRNEVIPVFSLKRLFGMPEEAADTQLLITETHGMKLAIEVDTVLGIVNVEEEDIKQIPMVVHTEETGYLEDVVKLTLPESNQEEIVISIAVDTLMSDHEFGQIEDALEKEMSGK